MPCSLSSPLIAALAVIILAPVLLSAEKALSEKEQTAFLAERTTGLMLGSFDAYASLMYADSGLIMQSTDTGITEARLESPFPDFYNPAWAQVFDAVARQTGSSWRYGSKSNTWVFAKPSMPLPFTVVKAKGWTSDDRGPYVSFKPPVAPAGMDIYMMGEYSTDSPDEKERKALLQRVRNEVAVMFAANFKEDVTAAEMKTVRVGGYEALFFTTAVPESGTVWRQWVIVDSGMAFAIVSAIKMEQEKAVLPDVEAMAGSFKVVTKQH